MRALGRRSTPLLALSCRLSTDYASSILVLAAVYCLLVVFCWRAPVDAVRVQTQHHCSVIDAQSNDSVFPPSSFFGPRSHHSLRHIGAPPSALPCLASLRSLSLHAPPWKPSSTVFFGGMRPTSAGTLFRAIKCRLSFRPSGALPGSGAYNSSWRTASSRLPVCLQTNVHPSVYRHVLSSPRQVLACVARTPHQPPLRSSDHISLARSAAPLQPSSAHPLSSSPSASNASHPTAASSGSSSPAAPPLSSPFLREARLTLRTDTPVDSEGDSRNPTGEMSANYHIEGPQLFAPVAPHPQMQAAFPGSGPNLEEVFTSVVKVFTDYTDPNFAQPWQMRRQLKSTGSGFIISGRRIMTNAHCVAFQNRVLVRKHGSPKKYLARVLAVGHESDLAVLTVEEDEFWEGVKTLSFGDVPHLQDAVVVVGYPTGGDNLSITAGVVSRVDINTYAHSNFRLLCAQIDAAINPGNSGGPAFKDHKVVGVAFQGYDDAQNIGYIVPTPVIEHFLADLEKNRKYTGFVTLGITYQPMENCSLRKYLGIDEVDVTTLPEGVTATGILVIQADELRDKQYRQKILDTEGRQCSEDEVGLRKNDVILALDGINVADDGTIFFRNNERVHLAYAIAHKFTGDTVQATILRDKKVINVTVPLTPPNFLVPEHQWDQKPRYYIYGGLVFVPMTLDYLKDEFGKKFYERAPSTLLKPLADIFAKRTGEESLVLSQILASDLTIGYDLKNIRLTSVDGEPVTNLMHLAQLLEGRDRAKRFVIFEFEHQLQLVLDSHQAAAMQDDILRQHSIPSYRSEEI